MKFLIIINNHCYLQCQDKTVFFDTEDEAKKFIEGCAIINIIADMTIKPIDASEINDEVYINYKDVHYM